MEGIYPIIIEGELVGKLTVTAQGPLTAFDAVCKTLPGIVRLSVYGGGREGYLGVLSPEGEELSLHKKLSRNALRDFPEIIESVEPSGLLTEHLAAAAQETAPVPEESPAPQPEPAPDPVPDPGTERSWYSSPDGALVCFDGARQLIALPQGDPRIPPDLPGTPSTVEGREYQIYAVKDGRLQQA